MLGVFLDTETSGLDPFVHVPLELGLSIVDLASGTVLGEFETLLRASDNEWAVHDPISIQINGLTKAQIDQGRPRADVAQEIEGLFSHHGIDNDRALFICQNPAFDRPFFSKIVPPYRQDVLHWPYHWLDLASMYWAIKLAGTDRVGSFGLNVSKDIIARELGISPEQRPHRAMNGVRHLIACYQGLVGWGKGQRS
jgi:DNA polymerase-3 subunit epsilon/oligoribonuclease